VVSKALVGPLPTIRFRDGTVAAYTPPVHTGDPRWAACTEHRPGCDCREAELAEQIAELRAYLKDAETAAAEVLAGHPTWAWSTDPTTGEQRDVSCRCTGCQIARAAHLRTMWRITQELEQNGAPS
jgi:hypothetical protein